MAGEATPTLDWSDVLSTTLMSYIDSGMLHDQVFTSTALLKWLMTGKRIRKLSGGERIKVGILYAGPGNYKRYSGDETLNITQQPGRTVAFFNWKQASGAAVINGLEQRQNGGEAAVKDLAKDRIRATELEIGDNLTTDAFSLGTTDGSKQVTGLAAMIADDPTSGTYANIDSSVNTKWRNQVTLTVGAGATNLLPALRVLHNNCMEGSDSVNSAPDAIFCTQAIHETAEAVVQPAIRYAGGGGEGEMGINPMFRGAKFLWDSHCQSQTLYMLNSNHLFFFMHRDAALAMTPEGFQRPINQDAYTAQILFQGNMGTNNRRKLGKLGGVS